MGGSHNSGSILGAGANEGRVTYLLHSFLILGREKKPCDPAALHQTANVAPPVVIVCQSEAVESLDPAFL